MNQESIPIEVQTSYKGDILVVDDTPANLRLLTRILQENDYHVRPVPDGGLALAAAQAKLPDLVLLDIRMPGMDGFQVCEKLKSDPGTQDMPIIFISALDAVEDKVKAFSVGGVDYITKPFQSEEVIARVENHLNLRRLQAQLETANSKMARELALAGEVQSSFIPKELPQFPGWQLAVTMQSAHETSGDFFDAISLPRGYTGILMADVNGKGVAAALYMALSWSLFRTYAGDFPNHPEMTLTSVNQRLVEDTSAKHYVSVFFGILDPKSGRLNYSNGGHSPPLLINSIDGEIIRQLGHSGKPLGITEEEIWEQKNLEIQPGEALVIHTGGVAEARNQQQESYKQQGLIASIQKHPGLTAVDLVEALYTDLQGFMDDTPQEDDLALAVLAREEIDLS
jgi:sigma-B regulation protein RsbU (phosphoserine phosphatase)